MTDYSNVAKLYNETAQNWDRDEPIYRSDREARPKLVELAARLQPKTILDLGCGEGYVTRMLAKATGAKVIGADISKKLIGIARRKERKNLLGIDYVYWNMKHLELLSLFCFEGCGLKDFDLISAAFSTHYLSLADHTLLFRDAARITKNMIIATMDPESYWKTLKGRTTYEEDEGKTFKDELKGNGKKAEVWYVHRTQERMERDFKPFKIVQKILIPCREASFDFAVYQLHNPDCS